jgi:hypothetical protein
MFTVVWIFKSPVYKGFGSPLPRISPGQGFPAIARETPILLAFLQFRTLFGSPFSTRFLTSFLRALNNWQSLGALFQVLGAQVESKTD